jgi:hypothetical protein
MREVAHTEAAIIDMYVRYHTARTRRITTNAR